MLSRNPDWAVNFDMDPEAARKTRCEMFARITASKARVGGDHFPFFGNRVASGNGKDCSCGL
jgi:hypothetical protein